MKLFQLHEKKIRPKISIIVIGFEMERELERTIFTLQPPYQQDLLGEEIEIILVDNGSAKEFRADSAYTNIEYLRVQNPNQSPAEAINLGLKHASADLIGLMIDGARMASPKLISNALLASLIHDRAIIYSLAYHLGHDVQMVSVENGYNQKIEDELLSSVPWRSNGYELFNISVFAGSSGNGWFSSLSEANALFMPKKIWDELGGVEERFQSPGGGLMNHDTFLRASELPEGRLVNLLGEGTFHQVHGGIATNNKRGKYSKLFRDEYRAIRGKDFVKNKIVPIHLGCVREEHAKHIKESLGSIEY